MTQRVPLVLIVILDLICSKTAAGSKAPKNKERAERTAQAKEAQQSLPPELDEQMKKVIEGEASYTPEQFAFLKKQGFLSDFCKKNYRASVKIGRKIGQGGFGIVYAGEYTSKDGQSKPVAVKFVTYGKHQKQSVLQEIYFMQKFRQSQRLMQQLICFYENASERKKRLAKLKSERALTKDEKKEFKNPRNKAIIVMKLMKSDLETYIGKRNLASSSDGGAILLSCAEAVRELHSGNVMHRDIKPQNFLVNDKGHIYLSDYGTAIESKTSRAKAGTPGFMAPELVAGSNYSSKVDIFSLGVSFIKLLTQRHTPFIVKDFQTNPSLNPNSLPKNYLLNTLLISMTSQNPDSRPDINQVVQKLTEFVSNAARTSKRTGLII